MRTSVWVWVYLGLKSERNCEDRCGVWVWVICCEDRCGFETRNGAARGKVRVTIGVWVWRVRGRTSVGLSVSDCCEVYGSVNICSCLNFGWRGWTKSKSSGLEFHEQKTSPLGSIFINKNLVLQTRFPLTKTESFGLDFYRQKMSILYLISTNKNRVH